MSLIKLATQVQLEIFENFFEDYNQYIRMPKTDVEFASRMDHIHEEFQVFEEYTFSSAYASQEYTQPTNLHRFGAAFWTLGTNSPEIQIVSEREYVQQKLSPLLQPSNNFPIATYKKDKVKVYPFAAAGVPKDVEWSYIRKPADVRWGYYTGSLGQFVYDSTVYGADLLNNGATLSNFTTPLATGTIELIHLHLLQQTLLQVVLLYLLMLLALQLLLLLLLIQVLVLWLEILSL